MSKVLLRLGWGAIQALSTIPGTMVLCWLTNSDRESSQGPPLDFAGGPVMVTRPGSLFELTSREPGSTSPGCLLGAVSCPALLRTAAALAAASPNVPKGACSPPLTFRRGGGGALGVAVPETSSCLLGTRGGTPPKPDSPSKTWALSFGVGAGLTVTVTPPVSRGGAGGAARGGKTSG